MSKILSAIAAAALVFAATGAFAEEEHNAAEPTHFPIHKPNEMDWSFHGPFGKNDGARPVRTDASAVRQGLTWGAARQGRGTGRRSR